jgi:threonine/homoserine/homoserine lactone efflux protein
VLPVSPVFINLLRGLLIGFSIAAPVGPIGVLCIRRTLAEGRRAGFVSGLGAASADAIYGSIAAFGLAYISAFLISHQLWLRLIGGVFLCYLGCKTFLARPALAAPPQAESRLGSNFASTFFLTLANPLTILSFAAIFAGLGVASVESSFIPAALMVAGVFCGSAAWWLLLSGGVGLFREKFNARGLLWVNRISGLILAAFGVFAVLSLA